MGQSKAKVHQIVQNQKSSGDATEETYTSCGWTMNNLAVSAITVRFNGSSQVKGKFLVTGSVSWARRWTPALRSGQPHSWGTRCTSSRR
jgi:hypothetical protein